MACRSIFILSFVLCGLTWAMIPLEEVRMITGKNTELSASDFEKAAIFKNAVFAAKKAGLDQETETKIKIEKILYESFLKSEAKKQAKNLVVSDAELKKYYTKFPLRRTYHLMLRLPTTKGLPSVEERIHKIKLAIKNGVPFKELVRTYSEDDTAISGGDLDFRGQNSLPISLYNALLNTPKNTVSPPVYMENSVHFLLWTFERPYSDVPETYLAYLRGNLSLEKEALVLETALKSLPSPTVGAE